MHHPSIFSNQQWEYFVGGFELLTRLSMDVIYCVIALSVALTRNEKPSDTLENTKKLCKPPQILVVAIGRHRKAKPISLVSEFTRDVEKSLLLWNLLNQLIPLVQRLPANQNQRSNLELPFESGLKNKRMKQWRLNKRCPTAEEAAP
ncbi:unnamed protein product [Lactuca saligna]|uniref:Uncharacterized protein n=1 Tax=Lactuca saligna TaxID=75948 RepID=A0AA35V7S2_LACSI|nr:unnamed protein product [Lactuca saligna]